MKKTNPIRILQLGSPTGLYGAERWILALIRHLDPSQITSIVGVIKDAPDLEAPLISQAGAMGFETMAIEAFGKANFSAVRQLKRYITNNQIHILHTHWYKTDIIGCLAVRGTRCLHISTPHGWSRDAGFKLQCYEMMDRMIFPLLDAVVPLSPTLYDNLASIPFLKKKLTLIQNGVDTTEIDACTQVHPRLAAWKNQGFFILGYIGQLIHRKGIDVLFHALASLGSAFAWKLVLIGDGEQRPYLEALAQDLNLSQNILFGGFQKDRLLFLNGFDVFVLPSRLEGIPRCLMEAMAAGRPVISSDIPGSTELVINGETGYTFPSENPEQLARTIRLTATRYNQAKELAARGKQKIHQQYSAHRMSREYQTLFSAMMGS
jgi:glycosyltransferase involved in cell wall biosynthesis